MALIHRQMSQVVLDVLRQTRGAALGHCHSINLVYPTDRTSSRTAQGPILSAGAAASISSAQKLPRSRASTKTTSTIHPQTVPGAVLRRAQSPAQTCASRAARCQRQRSFRPLIRPTRRNSLKHPKQRPDQSCASGLQEHDTHYEPLSVADDIVHRDGGRRQYKVRQPLLNWARAHSFIGMPSLAKKPAHYR